MLDGIWILLLFAVVAAASDWYVCGRGQPAGSAPSPADTDNLRVISHLDNDDADQAIAVLVQSLDVYGSRLFRIV